MSKKILIFIIIILLLILIIGGYFLLRGNSKYNKCIEACDKVFGESMLYEMCELECEFEK